MRAGSRRGLLGAAALFLLCAAARPDPELEALVIGGGPSPEDNQVAIENNVRYLLRALPAQSPRTVLFADGNPQNKTVLFEKKLKELPTAERTLAILLEGPGAARAASLQFRTPQISRIDGSSSRAGVAAAFARVASDLSTKPLLLYFTGHGRRSENPAAENNLFDLWGESLSVRDLAAHLSAIPPGRPLAIVMVQCYSGAFGNLLFEGGHPTGAPVPHDIAGFFATVKERMAAGCTPEVDEKEYRDFSSFFFAALTGKDRVGRPVSGTDFNRDGRVGMDEAFAYTLVADHSIDIPVCTSDVFLRRFVAIPDEEVFSTPYSQIVGWATPAQRFALEELSRQLKAEGEDRVRRAFARIAGDSEMRQARVKLMAAQRTFWSAREDGRALLTGRWPELADPRNAGYRAARAEALELIKQTLPDGRFDRLMEAQKSLMEAEQAAYQRELAEARLMRFVRLAKTVVLAQRLRDSEDQAAKQRFEKLVAAESRSLLPWQGAPQSMARR